MIDNYDFDTVNDGLLEFLDASPNAFFATAFMKNALLDEGFIELREYEPWKITASGSYFVTRNDSALIAFRVPKKKKSTVPAFNIMATHSDSPTFKIKPNSLMETEGYMSLNVERYGGMLCASWFDRPLSIAGRIIIGTSDGIISRLVNIDRDLLIIPNLAIHMNREANDGYKYNVQLDMLPLCGDMELEDNIESLIARQFDIDSADILDMDLYLYNRTRATMLGLGDEFIAGCRLDNLQCTYAGLVAMTSTEPKGSISMLCTFDNEEVGSSTKQGAASTFLKDTCTRVLHALGYSDDDICISIAKSFLVSADNAHAVHPNHPDKADPTNRPILNRGIVIKYSANQKYTTDAVSAGIFMKLCHEAGVPYQTFANRSDMVGGSTLGNISTSQLPINTVDIGLPQLAMHSAYETAGAMDTKYLIDVARLLYSCEIERNADGYTLDF